jgi:putative aldouronate transport system substrate-binding protein
MAAGEDCGLVGFGGQNYVRNAGMGYYYPMDSLLTDYAPEVLDLFSSAVWDSMRIGDKIYGVPTKKDNCYIIPFMYNVDLAEELGIDIPAIKFKSPMQMESLMTDAKAKRDELHPDWAKYPIVDVMALESPGFFAVETFLGWLNFIAVCNIEGAMDIDGYDAKTIFNLYETPEYLELCKFMQRMTEKNIFVYDRDNNVEQVNNWVEEGVLLGQHSWGLVWISEHFMSKNYKSDILLPEMVWTDTGNFQGIGWSISSKAAEPERAMMVINLFNTDSYLATLVRFGIEGVHYLRDPSGKMVLEGSPRNDDPANYGFVNWYGPWLGNLLVVETPESFGGPDNIVLDRIDAFNNSALIPSHMGFVLNQDPIQNELAACDNVIAEYGKILREGMMESERHVTETVDAFINKLRANGSQKILDEVQKQADEYLKNKP